MVGVTSCTKILYRCFEFLKIKLQSYVEAPPFTLPIQSCRLWPSTLLTDDFAEWSCSMAYSLLNNYACTIVLVTVGTLDQVAPILLLVIYCTPFYRLWEHAIHKLNCVIVIMHKSLSTNVYLLHELWEWPHCTNRIQACCIQPCSQAITKWPG